MKYQTGQIFLSVSTSERKGKPEIQCSPSEHGWSCQQPSELFYISNNGEKKNSEHQM